MHPRYAPSFEPNSQAVIYHDDVMVKLLHGPEAQLAAIAALKTLARGHDLAGKTIHLGEQAVTLAELRRNAEFRWLVPSAETLVHPLGVDDGLTPDLVAEERAWRETHIWLMLFAGGFPSAGLRGPAEPRGWQLLMAMIEVPGFMTGERPSAPALQPPTPVRIFGLLDMGLRR